MEGAVYKDNPHTLLELKEVMANFILKILLTELSLVLSNKIRRVDASKWF
jgi:hypothetical protein